MSPVASTTGPSAGRDGTGHAVVLGGGSAGMLAAWVLAPHFARVTVVERDELPAGPDQRPGLPQGLHNHLLLTAGYRALEKLLPGLGDELAAAGAPRICWTSDARMLLPGGWTPSFDSDLVSYSASRGLIDWAVRRRVTAQPQVHVLGRHRATGLLLDTAANRVRGVEVAPVGEASGLVPGQQIEADLVVDATGRSSRLPEWLDRHGLPTPPETVVNSRLGYATRWFAAPAGFQADWKAILINNRPPSLARGGVLLPVEGDRWVVTLGGMGQHAAPTDEAAWWEFAGSLASPLLAEAARLATPWGPVRGYRRTENRWRHYERLRMPANLVVTGDAACAFNPAYGQGLTVNALAALALRECLADGQPRPEDRFHRRFARIARVPWDVALGEDVRWPETEGMRPTAVNRLMYRYMGRLLRVAPGDVQLCRMFLEVMHLTRQPTELLRPNVLRRVWRPASGTRTGTDVPAAPVPAGSPTEQNENEVPHEV